MTVRVCIEPECPVLTRNTRCREHERAKDKARGSSTERGYGYAHQQDRAAWAPLVATGTVRCRRRDQCTASNLFIQPNEAWDLGHPDAECDAPKAPEHLGCNRATSRISRDA